MYEVSLFPALSPCFPVSLSPCLPSPCLPQSPQSVLLRTDWSNPVPIIVNRTYVVEACVCLCKACFVLTRPRPAFSSVLKPAPLSNVRTTLEIHTCRRAGVQACSQSYTYTSTTTYIHTTTCVALRFLLPAPRTLIERREGRSTTSPPKSLY